MLNRIIRGFILLTFSFAFFSGQAVAEEEKLIIATAAKNGAYYPVGVAISTLLSNKLVKKHDTAVRAIETSGPLENIQLLEGRKADLAILRGLEASMAFQGRGPYCEPLTGFKSISMLWENAEHFILLAQQVKAGNIRDLKGLKNEYSLGPRGSGIEISGQTILEILGLDLEKDITLIYLDNDPAFRALVAGRIGGLYLSAGPPVGIVERLYSELGAKKITLLEFTDEQLQRLRNVFPIWTRYVLKAGTYSDQQKDINTIAQPNFLACRADLPEDTVYLITKTIYENLQFMRNIHPATKAIKLERALSGLPVPLHRGAARFFMEKGVAVPAELMD